MRKTYNLIVVIPIGPNTVFEFVSDTIESIVCFTGPNRKIVLIDDTGGENLCAKLQSQFLDLDVVKTPGKHGPDGGLYLTLSLGYLYAYKKYDFKIILKLDTDALVIGDKPEEDAIDFFARHPNVGIIGHFGLGTAPDVDDSHWSKARLLEESRRKSLFRDPQLCLFLRRRLREARSNGFRLGDYIFGGAYFMSRACVRRLSEKNFLLRKELGRSLLQEDHIFGLLVKAAGLELADFAAGELPMGMEWKSLPAAPAELVAKKKKVIHSTRRWEGLDEKEIRRFFREIRGATGPVQSIKKTFSKENLNNI